jgi:cyclophilin family peptidyl-prolyl cis-trans isomerase
MTPPRRRGRRVPPRYGERPAPPATPGGTSAGAAGAGAGAAGPRDAEESAAAALERRTRAQNRAAKRAVSGVRPKQVRGRVSGRQSRGYSPAVLGLAIAAVVVVAAVILIGNPFGGGAGASASPGDSGTPGPTRPALADCPTEAPTALAAGQKRDVTIDTALGTIVIEVDADLAPVAAANFVALADCGYYDGVIFHRVIPGFVAQGGDGQYGWIGALDRSLVGQGGPGYEFDDEPIIGDYTRGTVAMANSGANTNGSQFFICQADLTGQLPKDYVIFGQVTAGMDVVDQLVNAPRDSHDLPNDPVAMDSVTVADHVEPSASPEASAAPSPSASPGATQ